MLRLLAGFAAVLTALSIPQTRPNLSGTWTAQIPALNAGGVAGGSVIRIEQDAKSVRIRRSYGREAITNPPMALTIVLDGKDTSLPYVMSHREGVKGTLSARARWDGSRLVIVTTRTMTDIANKISTKTETNETFSLDGPRLIVERVVSSGKVPPQKDIWIKQ